MTIPSWPELHGALTHFPVAFLIMSALFEIAALVLKKPEARFLSFWMLLIGAVMSLPALLTGWIAGKTLFGGGSAYPSQFVWHRAAAFSTSGISICLLIWRYSTRETAKGSAIALMAVVALIAAAGVTVTGNLGGTMLFQGLTPASSDAIDQFEAPNATSPASTTSKPDLALVATGKKLFASNNCGGCHRLNGAGGGMGPDLSHEGRKNSDPKWQEEHLKNPKKFRPNSIMPPYASLSAGQLKALSAFLVAQK